MESNEDLLEKISELEKEIGELEEEVGRLEFEVNDLESDKNNLESENSDLEEKLEILSEFEDYDEDYYHEPNTLYEALLINEFFKILPNLTLNDICRLKN